MSHFLDLYRGAEELDLEEVTEVATTAGEAAAEAVRAEVAEIAEEVAEVGDQVEELVEEMEDQTEAVEEISEAVEGMESLLNSGSYNSVAMAALFNRADRLSQRLGGRPQGERLGAESLADASTAELMVRDGLESFMETAKRWAKTAIEFIKHIFNTIMNFFTGLFNQATALQKRAEQLKKRIKDGAEIKKEVKAGGWAAWTPNGTRKLMEDNSGKFLDKIGQDVSKLTEANVKDAIDAYAKGLQTEVKSVSEKESKKGDVIFATVGNAVRVISNVPEFKGEVKAADLAAHLRKFSISYKVDADDRKKVVGEKVADRTSSELIQDCDWVIDGAVKMKKAKADSKFTSATRDKLIGHINAVYAAPGEDGEDQRKETRGKVAMVQASYAAAAKLSTVVNKINGKILSAHLDRAAAFVSFGAPKADK